MARPPPAPLAVASAGAAASLSGAGATAAGLANRSPIRLPLPVICSLVRQSREQVERLQERTLRRPCREVLLEYRANLAGAIDVAESPVRREAEVLVAMREGQSIGLDR